MKIYSKKMKDNIMIRQLVSNNCYSILSHNNKTAKLKYTKDK